MTNLKCNDCGRIFTEPAVEIEDMTPGGSFEGGTFYMKNLVCPYCGGDYEEVEEIEEEEEDIVSENDLKDLNIPYYNITSLNNNVFGNNKHIHISGK